MNKRTNIPAAALRKCAKKPTATFKKISPITGPGIAEALARSDRSGLVLNSHSTKLHGNPTAEEIATAVEQCRHRATNGMAVVHEEIRVVTHMVTAIEVIAVVKDKVQ